MKSPLRCKTIWFGLAVAALPLLESLQEVSLPSWALTLIGALVIGLRMVTTEGVSLRKAAGDASKVAFIILCAFGSIGCSALHVKAVDGDKINCKLKRSGDEPISCTLNGEPLFSIKGPAKLGVECPK